MHTNIRTPQYIRQTLIDVKGKIDSNKIIVGDFNTPLTPTDRSSKQTINKETQVLNDTLDEMDLFDIFRIFPSKCRRIHLFLKCTWNILQDRPHLGSQTKTLKFTFLKFKKIEIVSSIFSDHNAMRLDINYKEKNCKKHEHMEIKQHISK